MSTETAKQEPLAYRVTKRENCLVEIELQADAAQVEQKLQAQLKQLAGKVAIPGFRPGKAPMSLLRRRYGADILDDLALDLSTNELATVLVKEKVRMVGRPRLLGHELGEGKANTIRVGVEEFPKVDVSDSRYKGVTVSVHATSVLDKDVDEAVNSMLEDDAELAPVSGRAAQQGDLAEVKVIITPAGGPAKAEETYRLRLGQDELVAGFDAYIMGKETGASFTVQHALADAAADTPKADYAVTLVSLQANRAPELTDEIAKKRGAENAADLRAKMRERLEEWSAQTKQRELRGNLRNELVKLYPLAVPPSFVAGLAEDMIADAEREMKQYGGTFDRQQMGGAVQAAAETKARVMLILEAVAVQEKIEVTDADVTADTERMFAQTQLPEADRKRIVKRWREDGTWDNMRFNLKQDKAFNFIVEHADIKEQKAEA